MANESLFPYVQWYPYKIWLPEIPPYPVFVLILELETVQQKILDNLKEFPTASYLHKQLMKVSTDVSVLEIFRSWFESKAPVPVFHDLLIWENSL